MPPGIERGTELIKKILFTALFTIIENQYISNLLLKLIGGLNLLYYFEKSFFIVSISLKFGRQYFSTESGPVLSFSKKS